MKRRIVGIALVLVLMVGSLMLFAPDAYADSQMLASDICVEIIQSMEGFQAIPYWDYAQWTVGFGTECPDEDLERYRAEGIPADEAQELFAYHMLRHEKAVNKFIDKYDLDLSQEQFDALISYTYNLGPNTLSKDSYTIVQAITSGATDNELIYAFSIYCMAGGEFQPGLMRRRLVEANLFLNGVYDDYPPESYCYVHYDANGGVRDASAQGYDANMAAVPLSVPTREGYTFVGWYTEAEGGVRITSLNETHHGITLYAHWEEGVTEVETPSVPTSGVNVTVTSGAVHLRSGPGMSYGISIDVYEGDILTITGTTEADGLLWGKCSEGWICLSHTNYYDIVDVPEEPDSGYESLKLPVYATVVDSDGVTVYNGPHTTYPKVGSLSVGDVILLEEYICFNGYEWARYEGGWVRLNSKVMVHDENTLVHSFSMTATATLAIRVAPGVSNEKVTNLSKGSTVTVYAVAYVEGAYWGRISSGWVNLSYSDFDPAKLTGYQDHVYGDWYTVTPSTCTQQGVERRDCLYCSSQESRQAELSGHSMTAWEVILEATCVDAGMEQCSCTLCGHTESREIAALGHSFTAWEETKAPTAEEPGEESRTCQICGHSETRPLASTEHTFGDWYVTQAATCLNAGTERRDCQTCDHYEEREVEPLGHSLGQWYTATEPTCTASGRERRDCANCEHYESRALAPTGHSYGEWYETIASTTTTYGQERRDCALCGNYELRLVDMLPMPTVIRTYATITCDVLRIRSGAGTGYSQVGKLYKGDRVEILETKMVGSNEWGRIEQGWICLTGYVSIEIVEDGPHTTHTYGDWYVTQPATATSCGQERRDCTGCDHYETREIPMLEVELVTKVYATVTCDSLSVRTGAGSSYARVATILTGTRVEILEQVTKNGIVWGRTATGWIWLSGYTTLETVVEEPNPASVTMTVTATSLTIRSGKGTGYAARGYLYTGAVVQVYETVTVGSTVWARIPEGWIMAKYLK